MFAVRFRHLAVAALLGGAALATATAAPASADGTDTVYSTTPVKTWAVTGGQIYAMARVGNNIVIGGTFTALKPPTGPSVPRDRIAMIDASTGAPVATWNPGASAPVRALVTDGATVWAGGSFTTIGGVAKSDLAALSASTGAVLPGFAANGNGEVRSLLLANGRIYAGGLFTTVNAVQRVRLFAANPVTGVLDNAWKPTASWAVNGMVPVPGTPNIALGGEFSTVTGQARKYLASVNALTGAVQPWAPPADCDNPSNPCIVRSIAASSTLVYAAVGGVGGRASAYDTTTGVRKWSQYGDGDVQVVALSGNTVYAGGHYDPLFGQLAGANLTRTELAAIDATTGRVLPFAPDMHGGTGVWAILPDTDGLRIGGLFSPVAGDATIKNFALFRPVVAPLVTAQLQIG
ncbi:MAG: hypothetical protein JWO79_3675 [Actinomycetia bacterium]|jgi:hypothetical protein|nr:hypothetical protein [Actinomycetes bacterium]